MTGLSKSEMIKDFVLEDRDRFVMATEVHEQYYHIIVSLKQSIYSMLEEEIIQACPKGVQTKIHLHYANNQYLDAIYKGRTKVTIEFLNYFKQPWLNISGFGESEGNEIRTRIPNSEMQNNTLIRFNMKEYSFNNITTVIDLYDLTRTKENQNEMITQFRESVIPTVKSLCEIVTKY